LERELMANTKTKAKTVVGGSTSQKRKKTGGSATPLADIMALNTLTKDIRAKYFKEFDTVKYIDYIAMAIWGMESTFKLLQKNGSISNSRHFTPALGSSFEHTYSNDTVIKNITKNIKTLTPEIKENIADGWYAHGFGGVMGAYHIKGTTAYKDLYASVGSNLGKLISGEGVKLEVAPGKSVRELYSGNDDPAKKASIGMGLAVLLMHYKVGRKKFPKDNILAISWAIGAYVGGLRKKDANKYSGYDRLMDITITSNATNPKIKSLIAAGIAPNGTTDADLQNAGKTISANLMGKGKVTGATNVALTSGPKTVVSSASSGNNTASDLTDCG
jgi:hypothetical protein